MKETITELLCIGTLCLLLSKYVAGIEAGENQIINVPIPEPYTRVQDAMHSFSDGEYSGQVIRASSDQLTLMVRKEANSKAYYYIGLAFVFYAVVRIRRCKAEEKKVAEQVAASDR